MHVANTAAYQQEPSFSSKYLLRVADLRYSERLGQFHPFEGPPSVFPIYPIFCIMSIYSIKYILQKTTKHYEYLEY